MVIHYHGSTIRKKSTLKKNNNSKVIDVLHPPKFNSSPLKK